MTGVTGAWIDYSTHFGDVPVIPCFAGTNNHDVSFNFGQMPFIYTAPTGYNEIQSNNLPEPTIKNGREHFEAVTYTGNGSTQTITGLEFQPDFIWIKARDQSYYHMWTDSVRGADKQLFPHRTDAEQTQASSFITSFNSDGWKSL